MKSPAEKPGFFALGSPQRELRSGNVLVMLEVSIQLQITEGLP
jgi:hypothetical protein